MPKPRKLQISLEATPYYHCTSRCVRRAFLCGTDSATGKNFEHRRQWIEDRIHLLATVFAVDVCAYAVMSNHMHIVLHINRSKAESLTDLDICSRWHTLFKGTPLTQKFEKGEALCTEEMNAVQKRLATWRSNLHSISWFMKTLNEPIARQANAEDNCTGSFWESRFTCQALLDEKALAACLAYVDLNPVRAKMADTPEASDYTSIKLRVKVLREQENKQPIVLHPFVGNPRQPMPDGIPFRLEDYIQLVDWTGRLFKEGKRGSISSSLPLILKRLNIEPQKWLILTTQFESTFKTLIGNTQALKHAGTILGYQRTPGQGACQALL